MDISSPSALSSRAESAGNVEGDVAHLIIPASLHKGWSCLRKKNAWITKINNYALNLSDCKSFSVCLTWSEKMEGFPGEHPQWRPPDLKWKRVPAPLCQEVWQLFTLLSIGLQQIIANIQTCQKNKFQYAAISHNWHDWRKRFEFPIANPDPTKVKIKANIGIYIF